MKNLMFVLSLISLFASSAFGSGLQFENKVYSSDLGEFCFVKVSEVRLKNLPGATRREMQLSAAVNAKLESLLLERVGNWELYNTADDVCKDSDSSNQLEVTAKVTTATGAEITSIRYDIATFQGGGTYIEDISSFTFSETHRVEINELSQLIEYNKMGAFLDQLEQTLKVQRPDLDLENGWNSWKAEIAAGALGGISNFFFTVDGVTIYFHTYEIGSHADGTVEINMAWSQFATFITTPEMVPMVSWLPL